MTAALEGGEWLVARPDRTLPPGKTRYPFYRWLGGPQGRSGRAENLVPTGIRSRTVQPVAQLLYRLSYPAHTTTITTTTSSTTTNTMALWPISGHILPFAEISKELILYRVRCLPRPTAQPGRPMLCLCPTPLSKSARQGCPRQQVSSSPLRAVSQWAKHAFDKVEIPSRKNRHVEAE